MSDLLNRLVARSIGTTLSVSPRLRRAYESTHGPAPAASVREDREGESMRADRVSATSVADRVSATSVADRVSATSVVRQSSGAEPYRGPLRVDAGVQVNAPGARVQF